MQPKMPYSRITLFIAATLFVWAFGYGGVSIAYGFSDSAHGNATEGVNRSNVVLDPDHPDAYYIGECAHCHDTFNDAFCGTNDLMLFATEYFCVQCHQYPGTSYQVDMPYQGSYSRNHGGDTSITCPSHVKQAFLFVNQTGDGQPISNCGSEIGTSHYLADIADALEGRWGFGDTADDINPCNACHNPHQATQEFPCSLPSDHASATGWEVWGDEPAEKMSAYATGGYYLNYTPPYLYPFPVGTSPPELYLGLPPPQPSEWASDSTAPNYVTLCLDCHQDPQYSTRLDRDLLAINWENGDRHGKKGEPGAADPYYGFRKEPFGSQVAGTWSEYKVVMCTDCHDPHGSPNEFLLRTCVNGKSGISVGGPGQWLNFCTACHFLTYGSHYHSDGPTSDRCPTCHGHGNNTPFGEGF